MKGPVPASFPGVPRRPAPRPRRRRHRGGVFGRHCRSAAAHLPSRRLAQPPARSASPGLLGARSGARCLGDRSYLPPRLALRRLGGDQGASPVLPRPGRGQRVGVGPQSGVGSGLLGFGPEGRDWKGMLGRGVARPGEDWSLRPACASVSLPVTCGAGHQGRGPAAGGSFSHWE